MVYVATSGMITAIGNTVEESWQSILDEKHGLSNVQVLRTVHSNDICVGEIKISNAELANTLHLHTNGISRTTLLGIWAMQEAVKGIDSVLLQSPRTAFINATSVGGMSDVENIYDEMIAPQASPETVGFIDSLDCADCTLRIAQHFGFSGFQTTISTACSSSANAILLGARMIAAGECDMAICGGTDALTRFTLNGFNALKNVDAKPCKPFDKDRNGLNLGEAAGYIVLMNEQLLKQTQIQPIALFAGYGNTNEAYHPTAPHPDGQGALLTMQRALDNSNIPPHLISYVNAHGTATLGNDLSEGNAIRTLFGNNIPPVSSTKSFTGHTLAAAGVVEAIISSMAIKNSVVPANLHFENPIEPNGLSPTTQTIKDIPIQYVLSNSFAFGGNNVSLVFSKTD